MGSYSLLNVFLGFLAFRNFFLQMASLIYFIAFSIALLVAYLKAVIKKQYWNLFIMSIIDCVFGTVFIFQAIMMGHFDVIILIAVFLRVLFSIVFFNSINARCTRQVRN